MPYVDHTVCPFFRHPEVNSHEILSNKEPGNVALISHTPSHPHPATPSPFPSSHSVRLEVLPVLKISYAIQWSTVVWGYRVDSCGFSWRPVADCCGRESVGSLKCGEFFTYVREYWRLKDWFLWGQAVGSVRLVTWQYFRENQTHRRSKRDERIILKWITCGQVFRVLFLRIPGTTILGMVARSTKSLSSAAV